MKAYYNPEGITFGDNQEVDIVAWDRDKYFTFKDSTGEVRTDKQWKFSVKRSNRMWELPEGYLDDVLDVTRKSAAEALKGLRKKSVVYRVKCEHNNRYKDFKSLKNAMNFCKSNPGATFLNACFYYKNGSCSTPVLEKQDGEWYYFGSGNSKRLSYKTLNKFCLEN